MLKFSLKFYILITAIPIVFLMCILTILTGHVSYKQNRALANQNAQNISHLISEHVQSDFAVVDLILQEIDNKLKKLESSDTGANSSLSDLMRLRLNDAPSIRAFFIIGSDGYIIHDTDRTTPPVSLADREYFLFHKTGPETGLYIGKPLISRSKSTWFISISRRISTADRSFSGVIVAAMELNNINNFYSELKLDASDIVSLWSNKGRLYTSWPQFETQIGLINPEFKSTLEANREGVTTLLSFLDKRRKITAVKEIKKYPLMTVVEIDESNMNSLWLKKIMPALILFGILVITMGLFFWFSWKYISDLRNYQKELQFKNSQLLISEDRYLKAQKIGQVGNWEYDLVTENFWGSDQAKQIYGFDKDSKTFTTDEVEKCIPERKRVHKALIDLIEKDKPYNLEFEIHPVSGPATRIIRSKAEIIRDNTGSPLKVVGVIQDITGQKEAEQEKEKLKQELRHAQKIEAIGRLAGGVAHDFNNMLSIILGNTDIGLEDLHPSNPVTDNLHEIHKAAKRSADLTRQLLAFARKQTIEPKSLDLNTAVESMLKMLKRLIGEDIDLVYQPSDFLWKIKIDPSQIDQILVNFCVNSRDAINSVGKIVIETENVSFDDKYCLDHQGSKPGDYVMMAFSDDGTGMDEDTLENLFEPFFTTKETGKGTGLGLATIYGIVKQNNGFVNVYSEPEHGTTFKIYFPRQMQGTVVKTQPVKNNTKKGNETILLVEDESSILEMTSTMLKRIGYNVLPASNPEDAVKIAGNVSPPDIHLLITDVVMPGMNGRELSQKIRHLHPDIDCLFMSGYTANVIAHHGVLDEGINFINKPFSKKHLSEKLREILDGKK